MTEYITSARQSVWEALANFPETQSLFETKFRNETDFPQVLDDAGLLPHINHLPAIDIMTSGLDPTWLLNNLQSADLTFEVRIWTRGWDLTASEAAFGAFRRAVWQSAVVEGGQTYVGVYSCELAIRRARWLRVNLGQGHRTPAVQVTFDLVLYLRDNPREAVA